MASIIRKPSIAEHSKALHDYNLNFERRVVVWQKPGEPDWGLFCVAIVSKARAPRSALIPGAGQKRFPLAWLED